MKNNPSYLSSAANEEGLQARRSLPLSSSCSSSSSSSSSSSCCCCCRSSRVGRSSTSATSELRLETLQHLKTS
eukprot:g24925.t1